MDILHTIKTDNYKLIIENVEGNAFCHLQVYNWTASVYKQMLIELEQVKEAIGSTLWCSIRKDDEFKIKLVGMFGFLGAYESDTAYIMEAV